MKIIVAPDSFKGSVSAVRACERIEQGIREVFPQADIVKLPIADGGEGTVDSFVTATNCEKVHCTVSDPLGRRIPAYFARLADGTAVIEMAAASGLTLVSDEERDPMHTTTYGTGELMSAAMDAGCRKIILGIGGSATNDGGMGMAQALGCSFKDKNGQELGFGGGELGKLHTIDCSGRDKCLDACEIIAACDVSNTLCGEKGASAVFGPQKGASPEMVRLLDGNLRHYAEVIEVQMGVKLLDIPGTGAAGGMPAGLIAFCGAKIKSGIEIVLDAIGFDSHLQGANLVITGEGRVDFQSAFGKVPAGVAKRAKSLDVPVIVIAGSIGTGAETLYDHGIGGIVSIMDKPMDLGTAMQNGEELLKNAAARTMRIIQTAKRMRI